MVLYLYVHGRCDHSEPIGWKGEAGCMMLLSHPHHFKQVAVLFLLRIRCATTWAVVRLTSATLYDEYEPFIIVTTSREASFNSRTPSLANHH